MTSLVNDIDAGGEVFMIQTSRLSFRDAFYAVLYINVRRRERLVPTTTLSLTSLSIEDQGL